MAQMPIRSLAARAGYHGAPPLQPSVVKTASTIPHSSYLLDAGGISGPILRPGAVDQTQFKAALAEAQKQALLAPPTPASATGGQRIPTLTPAQLAAMGAVEEATGNTVGGGEMVIDIPGPKPVEGGALDSSGTGGSAIGPGASAQTVPGDAAATILKTNPALLTTPDTGMPAAGDLASTMSSSDAPAEASNSAMPSAIELAPTESTTAAPAAPDAAPESQAPAPQATVARGGPIAGARMGADGVWELPRLPDKDERLAMAGQKWRVVESEESRKLFLGPDGEFGWDDFLDVINPLQHIPLVNIAYRAITGDKIYGAARLVDFAFGPLAGVSTAIDLGVQSVSGKSMADNGIAMLFGPDDKTGHDASDLASINTASGSVAQLADAGAIRRGSHE